MRMRSFNKIILLTLALCYTALASVCVYGQSRASQTFPKNKQKIIIGFKTGRDVLFHTTPLLNTNSQNVHYAISSTIFLRKPINNHFSLESGIKYSVVQNATNSINKGLSHALSAKNPFSVSVPVTIQYYFLPEKSRIRPYIGGGMQYGFNTSINNITPFNADSHIGYADQTGNQYISILFTQGITFEINTKIQINQSFHFIPENNNKAFGIDIGIGFKLP